MIVTVILSDLMREKNVSVALLVIRIICITREKLNLRNNAIFFLVAKVMLEF